jgi:CMP-N-acetylneuraminic acid synthetase
MNNVKILIPARRNSKGLPFKNRLLFNKTIDVIPKEYHKQIIVSTDDEYLIEKCESIGLRVSIRPDELSIDTTSTKEVVEYLVKNGDLNEDDVVIMLYLTYPERTFNQIKEVYNIFTNKNIKSLLCKKDIKGTHPYLYMLDTGENKGTQLIKHDMYRRQDYPNIFEISHYISIFNINEINKLNNNLYNNETYFFGISDVIDIDTEKELNELLHKKR